MFAEPEQHEFEDTKRPMRDAKYMRCKKCKQGGVVYFRKKTSTLDQLMSTVGVSGACPGKPVCASDE